jgi:hypothetical protein
LIWIIFRKHPERYRQRATEAAVLPTTEGFIMHKTRLTLIGLDHGAEQHGCADTAAGHHSAGARDRRIVAGQGLHESSQAPRPRHGKGMGSSIPDPDAPPATAGKKVHDHAKVHK